MKGHPQTSGPILQFLHNTWQKKIFPVSGFVTRWANNEFFGSLMRKMAQPMSEEWTTSSLA